MGGRASRTIPRHDRVRFRPVSARTDKLRRIKDTVLPLLFTGLAIFVGLCALLYLFQEQLIFLRQPLSDDDRHAVQFLSATSEIDVAALDGTRLHAGFGTPSKARIRKASSSTSAAMPRRCPGRCSMRSFSHRGRWRPSTIAATGEAKDVPARTRWSPMRSRSTTESRNAGRRPEPNRGPRRSLGSGVAVQLAASRPVRAVMLVSPFDSLRQHRQKAVPDRPGIPASQASLRLAGPRPRYRGAVAGDRGENAMT